MFWGWESRAQEGAAEGALAVLLDLSAGEPREVLGELAAAWPGSRRIGLGPDPVTEGDPWFWSEVFQTPGTRATPPYGLTLTCTRYGPDSHRALIALRQPGLKPWPGGADVRLGCRGAGVFWGRGLEPVLVRGARDMLETWAVDAEGGPAMRRHYRGGDTAPRAGRMVQAFTLSTSRTGGTVPGLVVEVDVAIFAFDLE
ncbi:hypothetical protein [Vannielia litorea]|uniref:hypothetical protein n=1 Tax=Vannielia litorea TaxID=1217970 RepID=UPI001BCAC615|nr:hypothetical protein [Vannielia litorea]MBS8227394.1 hypothetical protein [Vannielia litorea]